MWFATGRMWMTTAHSAFWKSAFRLVIIELLVISSQNFQRNIEVYLKTKYCFILRQRAEKCQMDGWWFVLFHGIAPKLAHLARYGSPGTYNNILLALITIYIKQQWCWRRRWNGPFKITFMMMTVIVMANVFPEIASKKSEIKYTGEREGDVISWNCTNDKDLWNYWKLLESKEK